MTDVRESAGSTPAGGTDWIPDSPGGTGWKPVLLSIDVSLFRRPAASGVVRQICHNGVELACLEPCVLSRDNLFDVGFDALVSEIARLPRADAEPDGFFILSGEAEGRGWRLSGQIHELDERIWRVDVRGECPFAAIDEFLCMLGWPQVQVVFQLVQQGLTLGEDDFRRWAAACWSSGFSLQRQAKA